MPVSRPSFPPLLVVCLCAQWCGTCRDYRATVEQVAQAFDAGAVGFAWVDIEDHAEAVGDIDIDDFPTVLIARGDAPLFFGPLLPHAQTLERLVRSALAGELPAVPASAPGRAIASHVRAGHAAFALAEA